MQYYAFIENNLINGCGQCQILNEEIICLEITEEQYNLIIEKGNNYYVYQDGVLILNPEYAAIELAKAKENKQEENVAKCDEKRFNQTFNIVLQEQECEFDTSAKTQSDLMAAGLVTATGVTYDNWVCNNGVVINLTNADVQAIFAQFFSRVSPLYNIEKYYAELIEAATTKEEVEAIVIDYEVINENPTDIDNSNENTTV